MRVSSARREIHTMNLLKLILLVVQTFLVVGVGTLGPALAQGGPMASVGKATISCRALSYDPDEVQRFREWLKEQGRNTV